MSKQIKLPTLLVIADNPSIRFWVKKHLDEQFFVIAAENKQEAFEALNARLDFIIVDAALESYDALELCKELSKLTQKNLIPILLITGSLKKSFRDKALKCGVSEFLSDQLDLEELEMRIAEMQKSASMRQKTEDVGLAIKIPKFSGGSLKNKIVVNDPGLRLIVAAKKENKSVAFLFLRIDGFKKLQNQEEIAASFSKFINELLREKDLLIPSTDGGFILLLYNTTTDAARTIATKLRDKIQRTSFQTPKGAQPLTVSIAVASHEASEKGFNNMIDSAINSLKTRSETNLIIPLDQETS